MKKITWIIGSAADCNIVVSGKEVSPHHARLTKQPDGFFYLEDLKSKHGTIVEGVRISQPCRVTPKDTITLGPNATLPWPKAPPAPPPEEPAPAAAKGSTGSPLLRLLSSVALLLIGAGIGGYVAKEYWPQIAGENPATGPDVNPINNTASAADPADDTPKTGFQMGAFQASQPIKTIKVTIDVDPNGEPLQELVDLHFGFGFPLRLYPVGSDSREPSFAAFPQSSSLQPGQNSIDAGRSAWFEFAASPQEQGLDELKTTPTLLSGLTTADIRSIGFASRGSNDWGLAGYKIEINGELFATNDAVYARAEDLQATHEVEMLARQAEFDALETQVKDLREFVDSGLAGDKDKEALRVSEADLELVREQLNAKIGQVSGYYPWYQESHPDFAPAALADSPVKSVVVTLVTANEKNSGSGNSLFLATGPTKHLLAAAPDGLEDSPRQEQKFKLDSVALQYDPITKKQLQTFAIGMLGNDSPFALVPDRAKLQRVMMEVDGQVTFDSEQKEVDRKTLSAIQLLPPTHRDDLGTVVQNSESARQWYEWKPGKELPTVATDDPPEKEEPDSGKTQQVAQKPDIKKIKNPVRNTAKKPDIIVIMIPDRSGSTAAAGKTSPLLSGLKGLGLASLLSPIRLLPATPLQSPIVTNVRIATPGLLQDKQNVLVTWNVTGNASQISFFRVTLKPVLPHSGAVYLDDVVVSVPRVFGSTTTRATVAIDLSKFSGAASQKKYLYVEPQVTAFTALGTTINGAAAKGPIVPVSPLSTTPGSPPIAFVSGPLPLQRRRLNTLNSWRIVSCPGYQISGDCFGTTRPATPAQDSFNLWRTFTTADNGLGNCAWPLTAPFTQPSFPLRVASFGGNMGTSSWGTRVNTFGHLGIPTTPPVSPDWIVLRYDIPQAVNITSTMHVVGHLGFINGPATSTNTANIYASVVVTNPTAWPAPPAAPSSPPPTNEVLRIATTNGPLVSYAKQTSSRNNPLQLFDIPIVVNANPGQIATAIGQAQVNCNIPNTTPAAQVLWPTSSNTPSTMGRAYVSLTLAIKQQSRNGSEGVGVFGVRLVPGP